MAKYILASGTTVAQSATGNFETSLRDGTCQRATLYTYSDRAGSNQVMIRDAAGNWRAFGAADSVAANTLRSMLIDACFSEVRVDFTEGGVGVASVSMHLEAHE